MYVWQAGNGPSRRPVQVSKNKFLKYAKETIVEISSISPVPKIPEGIRIRLENNFSSTGNIKETFWFFFDFLSQIFLFSESHSAEKTQKKTPSRSQHSIKADNIHKSEGDTLGLNKIVFGEKSHCVEKT